MADGGDSEALAGSNVTASSSCAEPQSSSQSKRPSCSACGLPTKDHPGPVGQSKCLVGLLNILRTRVDELERAAQEREEQLRQHELLSVERQEALLATITTLEERVVHLESRLRTHVEPGLADGTKLQSEPGKENNASPDRSGGESSECGAESTLPAEDGEADSVPVVEQASLSVKNLVLKDGNDNLEANSEAVPHQPVGTCGIQGAGATLAAVCGELRADLAAADSEPLRAEQVACGPPPNLGAELTGKLFSDAARRAAVDSEDGFVFPKRKRSTGKKDAVYKVASRLKGAERIACTPYHLSGVSPVSSEDDVVTFCRLKSVTVTGCYRIRTRKWGTQ